MKRNLLVQLDEGRLSSEVSTGAMEETSMNVNGEGVGVRLDDRRESRPAKEMDILVFVSTDNQIELRKTLGQTKIGGQVEMRQGNDNVVRRTRNPVKEFFNEGNQRRLIDDRHVRFDHLDRQAETKNWKLVDEENFERQSRG
ncbi:unnamed protein product [Didymodactylos carnosus]|uniref:Uncharacterized protein n=1 Tax=Didymodactylos carnosus TaxID=1234261 RepID=A0A814J296_9BILA|nr:unnamed protein product [Didymodactylos carnosus]CAF1087770.1 unnamed protein product [Didymodactylos carnosus]CAF3801812.1 unnamed protein product [Didymodactylos carnosus]CAF3849556.1 unnamed protein product [Didymodactylos carnosus]